MNMDDRHWRLFFFLDRLVDQREAYENIKHNDEERKNSTYMGKLAIKHNIVYFILMLIITGLAIGAYAFFMKSGIWQGILMIIVAVVCVPYAIIYAMLALNCDIKQMVLNKKPIGWVSLLFTFLIFIAAVVAVVIAVIVL